MGKKIKKDLRTQALSAARLLLVRDGPQNLSMRKIAARIGCKAPSIYYYFENKDALIHTLIDEGRRLLYNTLLTADQELPEGVGPLERIETHMRTFVRFGMENPELYEIIYLLHSQEFTRYPKESFRKTRKTVAFGAQLYREAMDAGLVRETDPKAAILITRFMLHGYVSMHMMNRIDTRFDQYELLEELIERCFLSMGAQPPSRKV